MTTDSELSIGEVHRCCSHSSALTELIPLLVFAGFVVGVWSVLSLISNRNSRAQERLDRISRPASLAEIEDPKHEEGALPGRDGDGQGAVRRR